MSDTGLRVLELAEGAAAPFAGRMFASVGADVVKVELPGGDWTRCKPPLVDTGHGPTGALFHFLNAGKRSVVLDHDDEDLTASRVALAALWQWADVVLVDERFVRLPGVSGLFPEPGPQVVAVVSPYGMTGPDRDRPGTAATSFARSGEGSITPGGIGYREFPDAPYLVARGKVADIDAGVMAFLTAVAHVAGGSETGTTRPTIVDVSVHETAVSNNRWIPSNFTRTGWIETRASKPYPFGGMMPCKDGHAMFLPSTDRIWRAFVEIMGDPEWALQDELASREGRVANADEVRERIVEWAESVTMAELFEAGLAKGVPLGPYRSIADVATCPQLTARGFFCAYGDDAALIPGLPAPGWTGASAIGTAPTLGEHGSARTFAIQEER